MGCITQKSSSVSVDVTSKSTPMSRSVNMRRRSERKISGFVETESDFWGTVPFYVLKNRIRLLSFEINNSQVLKSVSESINEIFLFFLNSKEETFPKFEVTEDKYEWIHKYEQGYKVIRAIGLKENKYVLEVMENVTKEHLKHKLQETKFVFSGLFGSDLSSKTL